MKVRTIREFFDLKEKKIRIVNDEFVVNEKRLEEINSTSFGLFVEEVKEDKKEVVNVTKKPKKTHKSIIKSND